MSTRRTAVVVSTVVVAILLVLGARAVWKDDHRSGLRDALDAVPRSTLRLAFTDWAAVRRELDVPDQTHPTAATIDRLTSKAYDSDLSAASSIDESTAALQKAFGFSPATVDWEAYAQSRAGATMVVRLPDDLDPQEVRDHLDDLGFTKPASSTGVWKGGIDLVAAIDPTITPELQYVAVLADQHLVVTSDTESYAEQAVAAATGHKDSLADVASTRRLVETMAEPAAAMVWSEDFACEDLAMSAADQDSQSQADSLVQAAGGVHPLTGLVMAMAPDRSLTVGELFESSGQAKDDLRPRAKLAVGDAPGRGGSFSDDLDLVSSRTDGPVVKLEFRPKAKSGFVLSALDNGPVLFATC
ncbi:MAG: hypothetical protein JF565_07615 [Propionibacteriales bacterium]|nr:hypothetical protein [Propionibacteriales bacterium]